MENVKNEVKQNENIETYAVLNPRTDIVENQNEITIFAEMPGVGEKGVSVSFEDNVITLSGKIHMPQFSSEYKIAREEIYEGTYERSFSILSDINVNGISAKIKDGVLKVILPKSEKAKPKKIEVKVE